MGLKKLFETDLNSADFKLKTSFLAKQVLKFRNFYRHFVCESVVRDA